MVIHSRWPPLLKIKISLKDHLHISELIGAGRLPVVIFKEKFVQMSDSGPGDPLFYKVQISTHYWIIIFRFFVLSRKEPFLPTEREITPAKRFKIFFFLESSLECANGLFVEGDIFYGSLHAPTSFLYVK